MQLTCTAAGFVNTAFHQNAVPIVQEIRIDNEGGEALADLTLRLSSEPPVIAPLVITIDRVEAGAIRYIRAPDLRLDAALLRNLTEGIKADLLVTAEAGGAEVARHEGAIELLPPSHWGGVTAAPELLAAFVRPNDPAVDAVLHEASRKLAAAGRPAAIDGYAGGTRARVWELGGAVWAALADLSITYVLPPASFERTGQKVRGPSDIMARRTATCLDTALFFAACLEQAGLDPLVVLTRGHALVGLWLQRTEFADALIDDAQVLRKRRDLQDLVLVETTYLTQGLAGRFAAAVERGGSQVDDGAPAPMELAIDVRRARMRRIRPLDLGEGTGAPPPQAAEGAPVAMGLDAAPAFIEEAPPPAPAPDDRVTDRLERWKRRLLDLSLRNKLLNFKDATKAVPLDLPDAARFEDLLAEGRKFRLLPRTDVLSDGDGRSAALHRDRAGEDGRRAFLAQSLEAGDAHTALTEAELDGRLLELHRLTKTAFEEGGANILFLALGFLTWTQESGGRASRAPVILVPVSLTRSSVRAGFRLALHDEEARFNPTLLEMLRQDFDLNLPEFERELPTDASGVAVASVWQTLRTHVRDLRGWEVTGEVVLSTFSFTKFLMWKDLVERIDQLKESPVVRHLVDTPKQSYGDASGFPEAHRLDADYHPRDIFAPLSADSSQLAAVMAADRGKDFVLFGPPGTGKSQTIANIIAQCLAAGRTVLFVSQKTAALEVVQRRLNEIGLGDHCLEVHSAKAQKTAVLARLKAAWHDRQAPTEGDWEAAASDLGTLRDELNTLVAALHRRHPNGLSPFEAFGRVVRGREKPDALRLSWPAGTSHAPEELARLRRLCGELATACRAIGMPAGHPLQGIEQADWSPAWRRDFGEAIAAATAALPSMGVAVEALLAALNLSDLGLDRAGCAALLGFGDALGAPAARDGVSLLAPGHARRREACVRLLALGAEAEPLRARLVGDYEPGVFGLDLPDIGAQWRAASASNFVVRGGRQKAVRMLLAPHAKGNVPADPGSNLSVLAGLGKLLAAAEALAPDLAALGPLWDGLATDAPRLRSAMAWAEEARRASRAFGEACGTPAQSLVDYLRQVVDDYPDLVGEGGEIVVARDAFARAWAAAESAVARLGALAGRPAEVPLPVSGPEWLAGSIGVLAGWAANLHRAQPWCYWARTAREARAAGLEPIVAALEGGSVAPGEVEAAFDLAYARWWADAVVTDDPVLRGFLAERHEDAIDRYRRADERVGALARRIVRTRLRGDVPPPAAFGTDPEWGTLARELTKKARHMPLRNLFRSLPTALTRLTPCLMMSPLSIAQYLPAGSRPFDVVIFDEASQIPAWDAIGALARGRQAIVVGDPEQLPPTSVGDRGIDEVEDGTDVEDQESILDECLASNVPSRRLEWHYRSRRESLIAFANYAYYKGRLVTFPAAETADRAVHLVPVPGGTYLRGKARTNEAEARAVAAEVVRRLTDPGFAAEGLSLGVITFNGQQQRLIENLLDAERRSHPEIEPFFDAARWHEPVFVKNLENVQGDERDIILFSVTFAPEPDGKIGTISSLNKDGGHRRLNVAITRARREMAVFATLKPDQISLTGAGARGVRDFKHFLEFAERGPRALAEAAAPLDRDTDSPFEDAVKDELERRGWQVHPQVGVSSFRIDLGIVHPDAPGRYLAGVECDGATYHRSATARDRDRLRETVLRGLGWRIRRVWSTDWWMDAATAADRLHDGLSADLAEDRARAAEVEAARTAPVPETVVEADAFPVSEPIVLTAMEGASPFDAAPGDREDAEPELASTLPVTLGPAAEVPRLYAEAPAQAAAEAETEHFRRAEPGDCGLAVKPERFYDPAYRATLRAMVAHVVDVEGPVFLDVVVGRISQAHGFGRIGGKIRDAIGESVGPDIVHTSEEGRTLLWPTGSVPGAPVPFRPAAPGERDHGDIPLAELAGLALRHAASAANSEEVIRLMAGSLGLGRLRDAARMRLHVAHHIGQSALAGLDALARPDPIQIADGEATP